MYSDYIIVNRNFQSSVNLELDLGKASKIEDYIPTSDICDVIKRYIKAFLGISKDHATTLIGPYGKGKSFLLLVLSYLVGKDKDSDTWIRLVERIGNIDHELYDLLIQMREKNISFLPVLINSNYDNLTQSFRLALNDSLKREGLGDIVPESVFDVCLTVLGKWSKKGEIKEKVLKKCLELHHVKLNELKKELKNCSPVAYKQFVELYNCVSLGVEFNPLVNSDVVKTYDSIAHQILKYGYNGLFVIFDEFSKFLESNSSNLMKDLKIVQDFAELSARTNIILCCVAHKNLTLYTASKKQENLVDAFRTVEGRFKEVRFNRSLNENYQMISSAISKIDNELNTFQEDFAAEANLYERVDNLSLFNDITDREEFYNDCFPLNPLTVFSLIGVSELVAQNERTLFTFLSDTDDDSLNSFMRMHDRGLFNVDKIYDYFSPLLKTNDSNQIKSLWYRTESVLSKLENPDDKRVVKALSIFLLLNNPDVIPATIKYLSLAVDMTEHEVEEILLCLMHGGFIRKNPLSNHYYFAHSNSKKIDEAVAVLKKTKCKNANLNEIADSINEKKYLLPRKYNENNKIIRFFKTIFLKDTEFLNIPTFDYFFETNYCDGIVVYLLREKSSKEEIHNKVLELNNKRVVVKMPDVPIPGVFADSLMNYTCLTELKKQKEFDDLTKAQIDLILQETESDIQLMISEYFEEHYSFDSILYTNGITFNGLLSETMFEIYNVKLIFNNELINKEEVTTQYQKAINHVIDFMLDGGNDFPYSETSPENSVKYAVLDSNSRKDESSENFRKIVDKIKDNIVQSEGKKKTIREIVGFLTSVPYGVRNGVIPVIFAKAISELDDNAVLYYQKKEVELNATNLVKAISNDKYQLSFARGAADQNEYMKRMLNLFHVTNNQNFRKDVFLLAKTMKQYFIRLPQIVRMCSPENNFLNVPNVFLELKDALLAFDINPYEVIFIKTKFIFKTERYDEIFNEIQGLINMTPNLLDAYCEKMKNLIKGVFDISDTSSINSGLKDFLSSFLEKGQRPILNGMSKSIFDLVANNLTYDDLECVHLICKACTGRAIEDWDNDKSKNVTNELERFREEIKSAKTVENSSNSFEQVLKKEYPIDGMSLLLKNSLESVLDEFSDSIAPSEKVEVLLSLLKEIM